MTPTSSPATAAMDPMPDPSQRSGCYADPKSLPQHSLVAQTQDPFASAIYCGTVRHRRHTPKPHHFSYKVFMVYLDLAEIDAVFAQSRWWSHNRGNLASLQTRDFMTGERDVALHDGVANLVQTATGRRPRGPIRMLANLRYFNLIINPISCYYCFDPSGQHVEFLVAEVTNTPWGQRCHYVLVCDGTQPRQRLSFAKAMHVSPFQPMDLVYHWKGSTPGRHLRIHIDVTRQQQHVFDATLALRRQPMVAATMHRALFSYPWMTAKVFISIYWQAARLALKRIPYFSNPTEVTRLTRTHSVPAVRYPTTAYYSPATNEESLHESCEHRP